MQKVSHRLWDNFGEATCVLPQVWATPEVAQQAVAQFPLTKDPYALEFLGLTHAASERQLEDELVSRLQQTLHELGPNLAFA